MLDYRCFHGLGHGEGLFRRSVHIVNVLRVYLDVLYNLVIGVGTYHEAAITVYLFRQVSSDNGRVMFLINQPDNKPRSA